MKDDALHKRRVAAAAKQRASTTFKQDAGEDVREAAAAFFALWQDALRDAAKQQDVIPYGQQGRLKDKQ